MKLWFIIDGSTELPGMNEIVFMDSINDVIDFQRIMRLQIDQQI